MAGVVGFIPSSRHFRRGIVTALSWSPIVHRLKRDALFATRCGDVLPEKREDREAATDETTSYFGIAMHMILGPENFMMHGRMISGAYPKRPVSICT